MKRQNGGMASERRTTERQTTTPWLFCELFCWVIRNTEEFQKRQLLGRFVSLFVGSFGTLNNSRNATYLPHLLSTAETVPIWTIYSTHRTPDAWRWQSTYVWNSMAGWPQNDRTKNELRKNDRLNPCKMAGIATYLPHFSFRQRNIGLYSYVGVVRYAHHTYSKQFLSTISKKMLISTSALGIESRLQNGGNRYLPTTFVIDSGIGTYGRFFMVHGRQRWRYRTMTTTSFNY